MRVALAHGTDGSFRRAGSHARARPPGAEVVLGAGRRRPGARNSPDLTRRTSFADLATVDGTVVSGLDPDRLRALLVILAAAEASGVAHWCLDTAVAYAGTREKFGEPIGSFQAIKHLCAEMLETSDR